VEDSRQPCGAGQRADGCLDRGLVVLNRFQVVRRGEAGGVEPGLALRGPVGDGLAQRDVRLFHGPARWRLPRPLGHLWPGLAGSIIQARKQDRFAPATCGLGSGGAIVYDQSPQITIFLEKTDKND
jgi:hypothetical protein